MLVAALAAAVPAAVPAQVVPEPEPLEAGLPPQGTPYAPGVDVLHYDLELWLPAAIPAQEATFSAAARLNVRLVEDAPRLPLDLVGLRVDSVRAGGSASTPGYADGRLSIALPGRAGDTVAVAVFYGGHPDDGLALGPGLHGAPAAFADNWPNRARFWFPSVDHPSDKATVRFTVHAPAGWQVVANGRLVSRPEGSAAGPWIWDESVPIPTYTMVVGAAPMVRRTIGRAACGRAPAAPDADGCVEVSWWAFPEDTANARRVFRRAAEMVDFLTDLVGPYPYEKLANVQSATRFGGMENSSAIFYTGQGLASGRLGEGTVAHEIAHQWFGDAVTEAEWSHLWLSEGFATYFGHLFFEHAEGTQALRARMESDRREVLASPVVGRPIVARYPNLFALLNDNSYQKGGWVLHMLRGLLGDEAFFRGIRAYVEEHRNATALTADLQRALEAASGRDLGWFFEQWVYRPGVPVFSVEDRWRPAGQGGAVEVRVRQVQASTWPRFRVPMTVLVVDDDGGEHRFEVETLSGDDTFVLPLPDSRGYRRVVLDPDGWVLKGDPPAP